MHGPIMLQICRFTLQKQLTKPQRGREQGTGDGEDVVTHDTFSTCHGQVLLKREITMVGTAKQTKPEPPPALMTPKGRQVFSSKFASQPPPKKKLHYCLLHGKRGRQKTIQIQTKQEWNTFDKVTVPNRCKRAAAHWPLAFVSTYGPKKMPLSRTVN